MDNTSQFLQKGRIIMILIGIDIGKGNHTFSIVSKDTSEVLLEPTAFPNNKQGFDFFYDM